MAPKKKEVPVEQPTIIEEVAPSPPPPERDELPLGSVERIFRKVFDEVYPRDDFSNTIEEVEIEDDLIIKPLR